MKKRVQKSIIFSLAGVGAFLTAVFLMGFSISDLFNDLEEDLVVKTPNAILASANNSQGKLISIPVSYYDQRMDECVDLYDMSQREALFKRQFEWESCKYDGNEIESGLVDFYLDDNYLPVGVGGELTPNRGVKDIGRWFTLMDGVNREYPGILNMSYDAGKTEFSFVREEFYPLDEVDFSDGDRTGIDGHNHLFSMKFSVPFTTLKSGEEGFSITADDDTFVFVGGSLVIDMGGIHEATTGRLTINESGEIYAGIGEEELAYSGVNVGDSAVLRVFHVDRNARESYLEFKFTGMNLNLTNTKIAETGDDGIQVAYDPDDPTYVGPLGEMTIFKPDTTKGVIVLVTIESIALVVLSAVLIFAVSRCLRRVRSREE